MLSISCHHHQVFSPIRDSHPFDFGQWGWKPGDNTNKEGAFIPFTDVTLMCQDGSVFPCHRIILSGVSRYFAKLLADTDVVPEPWQRPVIMLEESVLGPDLKDILAYAYTGSATVDQARLPHFLKTACKLQVKGLMKEGKELSLTKPSNKAQQSNQTNGGAIGNQPEETSSQGQPIVIASTESLCNKNRESSETADNQWMTMKDIWPKYVNMMPNSQHVQVYGCKMCPETFPKRMEAASHVFTEHLESNIPMEFKCHLCNNHVTFKYRTHLKDHLLKDHQCSSFFWSYMMRVKCSSLTSSSQENLPVKRRARPNQDGPTTLKRGKQSSPAEPNTEDDSIEVIAVESFEGVSRRTLPPSPSGPTLLDNPSPPPKPTNAFLSEITEDPGEAGGMSNLDRIQGYSSLMRLIKDHHVIDGGDSFSCNFCEKKFKKGTLGKLTISLHILMTHFEDNVYFTCPECNHVCNNRNILKRHMEKRHGKKLQLWELDPYKKNKASKGVPGVPTLLQHTNNAAD